MTTFAQAAVARLLRHASPHLAESISIDELAHDVITNYKAQFGTMPIESNAGGRIMVHLSALTVGLYQGLLRQTGSKRDARARTAEITRYVYDKMATVPTLVSRMPGASRRRRLVWATRLFRTFPFNPPAYLMVDVPAELDVVAFDVHRCPAAKNFEIQGLPEVCVESWCNLDFELAERWGARLERSGTLAEGSSHCDFRWRILSQPK